MSLMLFLPSALLLSANMCGVCSRVLIKPLVSLFMDHSFMDEIITLRLIMYTES